MALIIDEAKEVLRIEADGLMQLIERLDESFTAMVERIYASSGRVVVGGIGKSGIVGRKIVATLNSTGTRSFFLHPVEAMHGDLGMVGPDDIFLALSTSGETDELNAVVASIRSIGCTVVSFTGNRGSTLAKHSDIVIDVGVAQEACPLGLAPTASSTALLAMGDALAVTLINKKEFTSSDFKRFHPGGALGQRLSSRVADMMLTGKSIPRILLNESMENAVGIVNSMGLGVTLVCNEDGGLVGIMTDGDIRRSLAEQRDIWALPVGAVMTRNPKCIHPETPAYDALGMMEHHEITVLPVTKDDGTICGVLHLHDILGKGDFRFEPKKSGRWS
ncbi:MAG: KpsF/GutQ family sugar-phosphate isomerase [Deltaproteobacteria bacterium]|nr:KpsF/GutQ family sugar-phosphate isomerase [Deltaproteobacteria bacterium]